MLASMIHHTLNIMFWTQFQPREFASANLQFYKADVTYKTITTLVINTILFIYLFIKLFFSRRNKLYSYPCKFEVK